MFIVIADSCGLLFFSGAAEKSPRNAGGGSAAAPLKNEMRETRAMAMNMTPRGLGLCHTTSANPSLL
jgi:hypothetical protein